MPDKSINSAAGPAVRFKDMGNGTFAEAVVDGGGQAGVTVTTNTTAVTGSFTAVQVLEDATFSAFTETGATGQAMTGFAIPAGTTLFGRITGYTLTSGKVRAYA
jgi:hypothetical protein